MYLMAEQIVRREQNYRSSESPKEWKGSGYGGGQQTDDEERPWLFVPPLASAGVVPARSDDLRTPHRFVSHTQRGQHLRVPRLSRAFHLTVLFHSSCFMAGRSRTES